MCFENYTCVWFRVVAESLALGPFSEGNMCYASGGPSPSKKKVITKGQKGLHEGPLIYLSCHYSRVGGSS